jgi:hypothetical protein
VGEGCFFAADDESRISAHAVEALWVHLDGFEGRLDGYNEHKTHR